MGMKMLGFSSGLNIPSLQFHTPRMRLHSSWLMDEDLQLSAWEGKSLLGCVGVSTADLRHQPSIMYCASGGGQRHAHGCGSTALGLQPCY